VLPKLTWDLFITMFFIVTFGYGFILQRERATATLVSSYIALAVTTAWGDVIYGLLSGNTTLFDQIWFKSNFTPFTTKCAIFGIFFVLLSLRGEYTSTNQGAKTSTILLLVYSFLNAGLIVSSVLHFLDPASIAQILVHSPIATFVENYQVSWIVLPAIIMIVAGFVKPAPQSSSNQG